MTNLPTLLTKIEQARAKATQGEWTWHDNHGVRYISNGLDGKFAKFDNRICEASFNLHHPPQKENMEFITLSANHILQLTQACRIMSEALKKYVNDSGYEGTDTERARIALSEVEALLSSEGEG